MPDSPRRDADSCGCHECTYLRDQLTRYPGTPLNFLIYRLTYQNDAQWTRFMAHFQRLVNAHLEDHGVADLIPHVAWDVHSDPTFDGASASKVRRHFNQRVKSITTITRWEDGRLVEGKGKTRDCLRIPRNLACVAVDQWCIDMTLKDMEKSESHRLLSNYACVELVSLYEDEETQTVSLSFVFPRVYSGMAVEGFGLMFEGWEDRIYDG